MNYLAHAYLSFDIPEVTVGNLIGDFVKGKQKEVYPEKIQQGIVLHRAIDGFTDTHPVTRRAKSFFRQAYGLYAGPLIDIVYDHFLAIDANLFPPGDNGLKAFAQRTYAWVGARQELLPQRFSRMFHYMRTEDWLTHYQYKKNIYWSFEGLARRASRMPDTEEAKRLFELHYHELEACYAEFFPQLKEFASGVLEQEDGRV